MSNSNESGTAAEFVERFAAAAPTIDTAAKAPISRKLEDRFAEKGIFKIRNLVNSLRILNAWCAHPPLNTTSSICAQRCHQTGQFIRHLRRVVHGLANFRLHQFTEAFAQ